MYIIATFKHSTKVEIALMDLKNFGIAKSGILALPLDNRASSGRFLDSVTQSDRESFLDLAAIFGMVFMLLGGIYGFVLKWGPILWGLIGLLGGIAAGIAIKLLWNRQKRNGTRQEEKMESEIVVMVNCENYQVEKVKDILWDHDALGVAEFKN